MIEHQVHGQFKLFTGPLAEDRKLGALGDQVAAFARDHKVAAKSIGVEYLESSPHAACTPRVATANRLRTSRLRMVGGIVTVTTCGA